MERKTTLKEAEIIFQRNFIGPEQLNSCFYNVGFRLEITDQEIPYSPELLKSKSKDYLLVLGSSKMNNGMPVTIMNLKNYFGMDSEKFEPCFYHQDWYHLEAFANEVLTDSWFLIRKTSYHENRGVEPIELNNEIVLPKAINCTYAFFVNFLVNKTYLWRDTFVWCGDVDHNSDKIYVGKYLDAQKFNKNGFNIHRHLSLKPHYTYIDML